MRSTPKHKLSKSAVKAWRISIAVVILLVILIPVALGVVDVFWADETALSPWLIGASGLIILIAGMLAIFLIPEIRWQRWRYQIDEHEIDLQSGIFIITRTLIPLKRVQHVDTRQGPILRSVELADVTISTAASTHCIPALDQDTADHVRNQISKFARLAKEDV